MVNMLFTKKKDHLPGNQSQSAESTDGNAHTAMESTTEKPESKDVDDTIYPSGFKLALLMMSTFVSMFLISLVSNGSHLCDILGWQV
jgi:uncharacterized membrane protein